jgi:CubicO group peptidase (beta-lactamase class C family)
MRLGLWILTIALSVGLAYTSVQAGSSEGLPTADSASLGFSAERLARLGGALDGDIKTGRIPGAVVLVARHGKVGYFEAFGLQNKQSGMPMRKDSIFRIYSLTKPIVSVAIMMLWEEGRFDIDDPIAKYLPELRDLKVAIVQKDSQDKINVDLEAAKRQPTIQQLLTHTGGLSYDILPKSPENPVRQIYVDAGIGNPDDTLAEMVTKIGKLPLVAEPGTVWEYSRSTDVLARLVEVVSGLTIDRFLENRIFEPLGMKDTSFWVSKEKLDRLAEPFTNDPVSGNPVHLIDVTNQPKFLSGNYGLVSTAEDYTRFMQMLINGGRFGDVRILGPKTIQYMTSDQIGAVRGPIYLPGLGYGFGLGLAVRLTDGQAPQPGSVGSYRWIGTAGTIFWVDPKENLTTVLMIQGLGEWVHYSRAIPTLVYQSIER